MYQSILEDLKYYAEHGLGPISTYEASQIVDLLQDQHAEITMLRKMQPVVLTGDSVNSFALATELSETKAKLDKLSKENEFLRCSQKANDHPLSLEELHEAAVTGEPIWLVGMEDGDGWVRIDFVSFLTVGYSRFGDSERWCFRTKSYGERVWAYHYNPVSSKEENHV